MAEGKRAEGSVKGRKTKNEPHGTKGEPEEIETKTARKQSDFMEREKKGLNWDPKREHLVSTNGKEQELPGRKGGIDDLDKQFLGQDKTFKKEDRRNEH
jgi:hypothetical protein